MSLIDSSYFVGEYEIQNVIGTAAPVVINAAKLTQFIVKYEPEYMKALLGATLYDEFIAGLAVLPTPDTKWTDLKNKLVDTTNKLSCIVPYVWNRYWTAEETKSSSLGQLLSKAENAQVVSSNTKLVRSWNDAMDQASDVFDWLTDNIATYPTLDTDKDFFYLTNHFGI